MIRKYLFPRAKICQKHFRKFKDYIKSPSILVYYALISALIRKEVFKKGAPVAFRVIFEMPQKLRLVWEEKNINQEFEAFHLKTGIQGLTQKYFCGRFNQPVVISGIKLETIHFIDFNFKHDEMFVTMNYRACLEIQGYTDLSFTIITPGISRNAFCFCIIF